MKISGVTLTGGIKLNTSAAPAPGPTPGPTLSNGYASGSIPAITITYIQKFPFASDDNSTIIGDLVYGIDQAVGNSSATSGYTAGGDPSPTGPGRLGTIQKFPFATDNDATNVGNLATTTYGSAGMSSENDGYLAGGNITGPGPGRISQIQKYSFANESSTSTLPANLITGSTSDAIGNSSSEDGYVSGGYAVSSPIDNITKFSFASFAGITAVGDLTQVRTVAGSQNSSTHGYVTGGWLWPGSSDVIDKFSFSSNGNATDVGDLAFGTNGNSGQSSIDNGYSSGGYNAAAKAIQKFSFATDGNASSSAELTENASSSTGQQG
jgi:hypothetical protein